MNPAELEEREVGRCAACGHRERDHLGACEVCDCEMFEDWPDLPFEWPNEVA